MRALSAIDAAIECAPERAFYRARKGLLLLQTGNIDAAAAAAEDACCMSPDNPFDAELIIALCIAREDRAGIRAVARGETERPYTAGQRAQAFIALGDYAAARELYELDVLDSRRELIDLITDEWIWRFRTSSIAHTCGCWLVMRVARMSWSAC